MIFTVRRQPGPCGGAASFDVDAFGPFEAVNQVSGLSPHWSRGSLLGAQPVVYFTNDHLGTAWWHVWRKDGAMTPTNNAPAKPINERAVSAGAKIARRIFERRGNHSEAHMSEEELAQYLSLAYELGQNQVSP